MTATTTLPEAACHPSTHAKHVMLDVPGCEGESTKTGRGKGRQGEGQRSRERCVGNADGERRSEGDQPAATEIFKKRKCTN